MNQVATSPMLAAKIAATVIQPRTFIAGLFTWSPMIRRLFVIGRISSSSGGVENPCTIPAYTSAYIGLKPRKFVAIASSVNPTIAR
jgi:hypothetical protein